MNSQAEKEGFYEKIIMASQKETRQARIWGTIFKFCFLIYLFTVSFSFVFISGVGDNTSKDEPHLGVVDILGPIDRTSGVNAIKTVESLRNAFEHENTKAIVLNADSGGGSPSQSDIIHTEILKLREEYPEKKVYAVVGDICASGCYYIISAADEIIANPTSMVGSIGVKAEGFGFTELMSRVGVERRTISVGDHKTMMDPFLPVDFQAVDHMKESVLKTTHSIFIDTVKKGRGDRLDSNADLFSGLVWSGKDMIDLGLIDSYGNIHTLTRDLLAEEGAFVNYTQKKGSLKDLFFGSTVEFLQDFKLDSGSRVRFEL